MYNQGSSTSYQMSNANQTIDMWITKLPILGRELKSEDVNLRTSIIKEWHVAEYIGSIDEVGIVKNVLLYTR